MVYLVVGRTGSGKNFIGKQLENLLHIQKIKSFTTRPKRDKESEDDYNFVTPEEADKITNKILETHINGYHYFNTIDNIKDEHYYIIDPIGVEDICKAMPDTNFILIYLFADEDARRKHAIERSLDPENEEKIFNKRNADEKEMFDEFEKKVADNADNNLPQLPPNITMCHRAINEFNEKILTAMLNVKNHILWEQVVRQLVIFSIKDDRLITRDIDGNIRKPNDNFEKLHPRPIRVAGDKDEHWLTIDEFASLLICSPDSLNNLFFSFAAHNPTLIDFIKDINDRKE